MNGEQIQHQQTGAVRTAISNGLVALLKKYYGVAPTRPLLSSRLPARLAPHRFGRATDSAAGLSRTWKAAAKRLSNRDAIDTYLAALAAPRQQLSGVRAPGKRTFAWTSTSTEPARRRRFRFEAKAIATARRRSTVARDEKR